jgi:phosphoribosylaminoimidazolecarboxamide formyltransferase/IMP cyclohydrolase
VKKAALLSVFDRTGIVEFAKFLSAKGFLLLTTSGTGKALNEAGIENMAVEDYTGQKEILDGRVKTLHPKIHAGLLAKRYDPKHMAQLEADGIYPIDVVAVNLYPFIQSLQTDAAKDPTKMIDVIDVGGPTMIRAAAKNFKSIFAVIDPNDYAMAMELIGIASANPSAVELEFRRELAVKVFSRVADYDLQIAKYFSNVSYEAAGETVATHVDFDNNFQLGEVSGVALAQAQELRYGENPHQKAAFYQQVGVLDRGWRQLSGKELSYNNMLDFTAVLNLVRGFTADVSVAGIAATQPTAVIVKHLNPCGVASSYSLLESLKRAKRGDPRSHFGGVLAFNEPVTVEVANDIREDFAEIVVAPSFDAPALDILKKSKNLRIIEASMDAKKTIELRSVEGGFLMQQNDPRVSLASDARVVSQVRPSVAQLLDLQFAWTVCAHVKSNAITIVKDQMLLASGSGQMSRIDSVEVALHKAATHKHNLEGAVAASDAFFPFPDSVSTLAQAGIVAIIAPGGAKRDEDAIAEANKHNIALIFAEDRHFKH